MDESIIKTGAILIISTFIIIVFFFIISTPVTEILSGFDNADVSEAEDEMNEYLPNIETAFWLGMSIAIITPAVIFVLWVFHREPDWYYKRRRY